MTLVGISALFIALLAAFFAELRASRIRVAVFVALFVLHVLASGAYYVFAEATGSDAHFYYYDTLRLYGDASGLGTAFVINFVHTIRDAIGGSFFDHFLIFQTFGFWGLVVMMKIFHEIHEEIGAPQSWLMYLPLFLPGLHFWTGAIGKDAPVFFGLTLAIWSVMQPRRRYIGLGVAIFILLLFRSHIALAALIALAIAALFEPRFKLWMKLGLLGVIGAGFFFVAGTIQASYQLDVTNADSVSTYMEGRAGVGEESGADYAIMNASLPVKVFTFWFRPFFLDAADTLSYIVSIENAFLFTIGLLLLLNLPTTYAVVRRIFFARFAFLAFLGLTLLLSAMSYNIGLNVRQKMMAVPMLLAIFTAVMAVTAARRARRPRPDFSLPRKRAERLAAAP